MDSGSSEISFVDHVKKHAKHVLVVGGCGRGVTTLCATLKECLPKYVSVEEHPQGKYGDLTRYVLRNGFDFVFVLSRIPGDGFNGTSWGSLINMLPKYTALVFENEISVGRLTILGEAKAQDFGFVAE